jgi:hypothetical protein
VLVLLISLGSIYQEHILYKALALKLKGKDV